MNKKNKMEGYMKHVRVVIRNEQQEIATLKKEHLNDYDL